MKYIFSFILFFPLFTLAASHQQFAPENNLSISVDRNSGISEEEFNSVLDKLDVIYGSIIKSKGANFKIERKWSNSKVNARAHRAGSSWYITMFGGLARYPEMTVDAFTLVACHELGHHIGGYPRTGWMSNEGNSDYFATLKCSRKMWADEDSIEKNKNTTIDELAAKKCESQWSHAMDQAVCKRAAMAGKVLGKFLASIAENQWPDFGTPDLNKVKKTYHSHPNAQCRLDTYFLGALCLADHNVDMGEEDPNEGTCSTNQVGGRPYCWYADPVK